jgi:hypothetical protein
VCRHVQGAIVGTESAGEVWRSKGYHGAMAVIPQFGTDEQLFTPSAVRPARPFTVGFVGRLVPEKGVDQLLTALTRASSGLAVRGGGRGNATSGTAPACPPIGHIRAGALYPSVALFGDAQHLPTL